MLNGLKNIISKIVIANQKNKLGVCVSIKKNELKLIEYLWLNGFIYGYSKINHNYYYIFLKYVKSNTIFKKVNYCNKKKSYKQLKLLNRLSKNNFCFIKTVKGIYSQKESIKKGIGGYVFAEI